MRPVLSTRLRLTGFVTAALVGTWLGHGLEYARSAGVPGLIAGLTGPLHSYMAPLGLALAVLTFALAGELAHVAALARSRFARLQRGLRSALRGRSVAVPLYDDAVSSPRRLRRWFGGLLAAQLVLYVLQENVEASFGGFAAPGLGAITGAHWPALLVHAAVALVIALVVLWLHRFFATQLQAAKHLAALIRVLAGRMRASSVDRIRALVLGPPQPLVAASEQFRGPPAAVFP